MKEGYDLIQRPIRSVSIDQIEKQHSKKRMTVWERMRVLTDKEPNVLYQNWGKNLDGASLVTAVMNIDGRDVACYGHDFTVRAGSMDATNGNKLANLFRLAGDKGIPLIGMNDSAGAYVPAGVGGLDGYAEAFTALRKISGVVPEHHVHVRLQRRRRLLPAAPGQLRHPAERHLLRPHRPGRREDACSARTSRPRTWAVPRCTARAAWPISPCVDEVAALRRRCGSSRTSPTTTASRRPSRRRAIRSSGKTWEIDTLLQARRSTRRPASTRRSTCRSSSSRSATTATTSSCSRSAPRRWSPPSAASAATSSASSPTTAPSRSGQIDMRRGLQDRRASCGSATSTTSRSSSWRTRPASCPAASRRARGIVQAGRAMLDAIVDVRTPRILLILRNAFGGAYASFNNYPTGADLVLALPTTRARRDGAGRQGVRLQGRAPQDPLHRRRDGEEGHPAAQRGRHGAGGCQEGRARRRRASGRSSRRPPSTAATSRSS